MIGSFTFIDRTELEVSVEPEQLQLLLENISTAIYEEILPTLDRDREKFNNIDFAVTTNLALPGRLRVKVLLPPFFGRRDTEDRFRHKLQRLLGKYSAYQIA